ncbi:7932_t:CDS:1, partial [Ambispora leptoticha]
IRNELLIEDKQDDKPNMEIDATKHMMIQNNPETIKEPQNRLTEKPQNQ